MFLSIFVAEMEKSFFISFIKFLSLLCKTKKKLEDILTENSQSSSSAIRRRVLNEKLFEEKCSICGIDEWQDKPLVLHLDHINGINNDNRKENLNKIGDMGVEPTLFSS